jgi:cadmium resistance protein CadD (predicted permease)
MLIHAEAFGLAFIGCAATNLDNILLVLASADRTGAGRGAFAFFATLTAVILLALAISMGVDLVMPRFLAWIGLVPFSMGLYELWPHRSAEGPETRPGGASTFSLVLPLAANSFDTLLVQTILFSDLASPYHLTALAGAVGAAAVLTAAAVVVLSRQGRAKKMLTLASRARPWILIVVGVLIFMDTGFDTQ